MKKICSAILSLSMLFASVSFSSLKAYAEDLPGNLYQNGDFENGKAEPHVMMESGTVGGLVATDEQAHSGSYSLKVTGRSSQADAWGQRLTVEKGKTYIFTGYVRLASNAKNNKIPVNIYWFEGDGIINKLYTQEEQPWANKNGWTQLIDVFTATESGTIWPELIGWDYSKGLDDYYVDDIYFGELALSEIEITTNKSAVIPLQGETRMKLTATGLNQLGNSYGVTGGSCKWSMDDTEDVYIEGDELVIKSTANAGIVTITVEAAAGDSGISKSFDIQLTKQSILDATNLYVNGNLETGSVEPFTKRSSSVVSLSLEDKDVHGGNYALKITGRESNSSVWGQKISISEGKTYILRGYGKLASDTKNGSVPAEWYWFDGSSLITKHSAPVVFLTKSGWIRTDCVITANKSGDTWPELIAWETGKVMDDYLADDLYFGELMLTKKEIKIPQEIEIPKEGEIAENLSVTLYNQFEDTIGFENVICNWTVNGGVKGVRIEDGKIFVDNKASAQNIELVLRCVSGYSNSVVYEDTFNVELLPHDDQKIYVENVSLEGNVKTGENLTVSYDYRQVNNEADASEITWYMADLYDGEYKVIEGKNGKTLEIISDYEGKYIKAGILPKSETGRTESVIFTNISCAAMAPEARNVAVSGDVYTGSELKGSYEFFDANRDNERNSRFQWLRMKKGESEFSEISGATEISYTITEDDTDAKLKFAVIPVSEKEPYEGLKYESTEVTGPTVPQAKNLKITNKGNVYTASYEYYHPNGIFQGESKLEWYVDGELFGKGSSVVVEKGKTSKNLTFKVTPVAEFAPTDGETVSVSITIPKKSTNGGGSSGGGGGGYVRDVNPVTTNPTVNTIAISDMDSHWAKATALNMVNLGVMTIDYNNCFNPQSIITRAEMVEYICKALGLDKVSYRNEFEDVTSDDNFSGYLQSAVDVGIISKDVKFRPNDNIKRCEFAKIIAVASEINKITEKNEYVVFSDEETIPDWAKGYIKTVVKTRMMIGNSDGTFNPLGNITKAECATVVERIINMKGV